jgi:hypothetical protein
LVLQEADKKIIAQIAPSAPTGYKNAGQTPGTPYLSFGKLITQTPEIHRHQFAYTGFLHGYAIDHIHGTHGLFVVCYNDELAVLTKLFDHLVYFEKNFGGIEITL